MTRTTIVAVLLLVGCNREHEAPVPPPPPPPTTTTTAPATTPAPTTTPPATTAAPATKIAAPHAADVPATTTTPPSSAAAHHAAASATCERAQRCCEAAMAMIPVGGLMPGCHELRSGSDEQCERAISTYVGMVREVGQGPPAACTAAH